MSTTTQYLINRLTEVSLYLILLEVCSDSPAFVIGQSVSVLLEKCVDSGDPSVPRVFQVLQGESSTEQ